MVLKRQYFNLHDIVTFSIEGSGILYEYFIFQYKYFHTKATIDNKVRNGISLKFVNDNNVTMDQSLRYDKEYFGKNGKQFVWSVNNRKSTFNGTKRLTEQTEIVFDQQFSKMKANLICDLFWRVGFISQGVILVHAACVANEDKAIFSKAPR